MISYEYTKHESYIKGAYDLTKAGVVLFKDYLLKIHRITHIKNVIYNFLYFFFIFYQ